MRIDVTPPARTGTTTLRDGRALAWAEWGPASGAPVLFSPGAATSRSLGFGADVLEKLGLRLIAVDRPGLGASSPAPGRGFRDFADDVRELARARALEPLRAIGFSQGAPFALACAAYGVVTRVALVSGTDELARFRPRLDAGLATLVDMAAAEPARAEAYFAGLSADAMWEMVAAMSGAADRAIYTEPSFEAAYRRALAEGFSQGGAGYARDTLLAMSPWPFDPAAVRVPVDLWYGGRDTSPVHSPDFGASLAARLPTSRRHFLPDAGGALPWTHAEEILAALLVP